MTDNAEYYDVFNATAGAVYPEEGSAVAEEAAIDAVVAAVRDNATKDIDDRACDAFNEGVRQGREAAARDIEACMPEARDPWLSRAEAAKIAREGL